MFIESLVASTPEKKFVNALYKNGIIQICIVFKSKFELMIDFCDNINECVAAQA